MKIAVSGSHSVGKTTLVKYIAEKYSLPILQEKARYFMNNGFPFKELEKDTELFIDFQRHIFDFQIKEEKETSDFVVDRTLFDSVSYLQERLIKERYEDYSVYQKYLNLALSNYVGYNYIFFIEVHEDLIIADGFRNINLYYLYAIQDLILRKFEEFELPIIKISTPDFEKRKAIVNYYLGEKIEL